MSANKKYEKGTLGWLREQQKIKAKKDGFNDIGGWLQWKKERLSKIINHNSLCDKCGRPFKDAGHGTHYNEEIEGRYTGRIICHKCYMICRNTLPDSYNNMKKAINDIEGRSKVRTEDNCIICSRDLNSCANSHPMKQYINGKWTGHWLCYGCWYHTDYKHRFDNTKNIIKATRYRRMGILKDPGNILGDNCEKLTSRVFDVKRLNEEYDKYSRLPNDHSPIPEGVSVEIAEKLVDLSGSIPQTTGRRLDNYGTWDFGNLSREWNKDFDIEICWCISNDGLNAERCYIIHKKEIYDSETEEGINRVKITRDPTRFSPVTEKYKQNRTTDKAFIKKFNDIWKEIINEEIIYD